MANLSPADTREVSADTREVPVDSVAVQPEIDSELRAVTHHVHEEFDGHLDPQTVDECLNQVAARFVGAPIRTFVPLLVRRYAREELRTRLRQIE